ncbi:MAG: hypothetical protein ACPL4C_05515, partial [Brevinematia bacterium]
ISYLTTTRLNNRTKNYIILPLMNATIIPTIIAVELFIIFLADNILYLNLNKTFIFILAILLANSANEIIISPYLAEAFNQNEKVDFIKLGIIGSAIIGIEIFSLLMLAIIYNHNFSKAFSFLDLSIISIFGVTLSFIILRKSFSVLDYDLRNIKKFLLKGEEVKGKIISKNFEIIFKKVEELISLHYKSGTNLLNQIKLVKDLFEKMLNNTLEIESNYGLLEKSTKELKDVSYRDLETLKELNDSYQIIENKLENMLKEIESRSTIYDNLSKLIFEILPLINYLKNEIDPIEDLLSSFLSNLKKAEEIIIKLNKKVPRIIQEYQSLNRFIKNLSKLATKINFIRVSFDIELSKTSINETNKERLSIISQKLDSIFKNINSIIEKIKIEEDKNLLEQSIEEIFQTIDQIIIEVEIMNKHILEIRESTKIIISIISDLQRENEKLGENIKYSYDILKLFLGNLKSNLISLTNKRIKEINNFITNLEEIEKEIKDIKNYIDNYVKTLKENQISIPTTLEYFRKGNE